MTIPTRHHPDLMSTEQVQASFDAAYRVDYVISIKRRGSRLFRLLVLPLTMVAGGVYSLLGGHFCIDEALGVLLVAGSVPYIGPWLSKQVADYRGRRILVTKNRHCCDPKHHGASVQAAVETKKDRYGDTKWSCVYCGKATPERVKVCETCYNPSTFIDKCDYFVTHPEERYHIHLETASPAVHWQTASVDIDPKGLEFHFCPGKECNLTGSAKNCPRCSGTTARTTCKE